MIVGDSLSYSRFPRLCLAVSDDEIAADVLLPFATLGCSERWLYDILAWFQIGARVRNQNRDQAAGYCYELGRQLARDRRYRAAWPALEMALALDDRQPQSAVVEGALATLETLLDEIVLLPGATKYLERALLLWCAVRHPTHPQIGEILNNLGYLHKQEGRLQDARDCYERALTIWTEAFGARHAYVAAVLNNLGALARKTGQTMEARRRYKQALAISRAVNGAHHPLTEDILASLGAVCPDDHAALLAYRRATRNCLSCTHHKQSAVTEKDYFL